MKSFFRNIIFSILSFYIVQIVYFPFQFQDKIFGIVFLLVVFVITSSFSRVFFKIIRLPHTGLIFYFLNVLSHAVSAYIGVIYLKKFDFYALNFSKIDVFGIINTPSVYLEKYTSLLLFCSLYCILTGVLYFLSHENKRK
jgi:hypothetical protein